MTTKSIPSLLPNEPTALLNPFDALRDQNGLYELQGPYGQQYTIQSRNGHLEIVSATNVGAWQVTKIEASGFAAGTSAQPTTQARAR